MTVVSDDHPLYAPDVVGLDLDINVVGLGIERIPYHFRYSPQRVMSPGKPQHVVGFGVDVDPDHVGTLSDGTHRMRWIMTMPGLTENATQQPVPASGWTCEAPSLAGLLSEVFAGRQC